MFAALLSLDTEGSQEFVMTFNNMSQNLGPADVMLRWARIFRTYRSVNKIRNAVEHMQNKHFATVCPSSYIARTRTFTSFGFSSPSHCPTTRVRPRGPS